MSKYPCKVCAKAVKANQRGIQCDLCDSWVHQLCTCFSNKDYEYLMNQNESEKWFCAECLLETFPFNAIDDEDFKLFLLQEKREWTDEMLDRLNSVTYNPHEYGDDDNDILNSIIPDACIDNHQNIDSPYYLERAFNKKFGDSKGFSLFHLNVRSLRNKFDMLSTYLSQLDNKFAVICLTETWLSDNDDLNAFCLSGYEAVHFMRIDKRGGGVSISVREELEFKRRKDIEAIPKVGESVFVEIVRPRRKNFIIGSFYRPPESDMRWGTGK